MLANVLPGLRDLRAPLAAGYLWLLALYISFEPLIPRKARGVWATLSHLQHLIKLVGSGIALSFIAYLLGAVSYSVFGFLTRTETSGNFSPENLYYFSLSITETSKPDPLDHAQRRAPLAKRIGGRLNGWAVKIARASAIGVVYGPVGEVALNDITRARLTPLRDALTRATRAAGDRIPGGDPIGAYWYVNPRSLRLTPAVARDVVGRAMEPLSDLAQAVWRASGGDNRQRRATNPRLIERAVSDLILDELRLARISLLGKEPEVFSEIDRLQSEGQFRGAVVPPMIGLAAALGWRAAWWAATIPLVAAVFLTLTGRSQLRQANDSLLEAIRLRRASVPTLDRIDNAAAAIAAEAEAREATIREAPTAVAAQQAVTEAGTGDPVLRLNDEVDDGAEPPDR